MFIDYKNETYEKKRAAAREVYAEERRRSIGDIRDKSGSSSPSRGRERSRSRGRKRSRERSRSWEHRIRDVNDDGERPSRRRNSELERSKDVEREKSQSNDNATKEDGTISGQQAEHVGTKESSTRGMREKSVERNESDSDSYKDDENTKSPERDVDQELTTVENLEDHPRR